MFECAAYESGSAPSDIVSMTYYRLIVTGLYTVSIPSISAPSSLHLGSCQARSSEVLNGSISITLSNAGENDGLTGTLTAQVTGDTNNLSIKTRVAGQEYNLTQLFPQGITIQSDGGNYLLDVSTLCPNTVGSYRWSAILTYTIQ